MHKVYFMLVALGLSGACPAQTTYELTNVGNSFSPALITMQAGDSVHLVLQAPHTCTEVSEATWNANGNTSNGGFNYPAGEVTFALDDPGTYYFVCIPHANMGMKGRFVVQSGAGIAESADKAAFELLPNPAQDELRVAGLAPGQRVRILNVAGAVVLEASPGSMGVLDIAPLPPGSYSVQVSGAHGALVGSKQLVIAR